MNGIDLQSLPPDLRRALAGSADADVEGAATSTPPRHRIFTPVTGEQLQALAYFSTSGDPLTPPGSRRHAGAPDKPDRQGVTKRKVRDAAGSKEGRPFFDKMARHLNGSKWTGSMVSIRHFKKPAAPGAKPRPIDVPSEAKRLLAGLVADRLDALVREAGWLPPTVVGFRPVSDFHAAAGGKRRDGVTIQDVFATAVRNMLKERGPWAVTVDLRDAFGNLPHQAIHATLKELGVNHAERRKLVELVRVRTVRPDGRLLKPRHYGIEQGNPASPAVFNAVMALLARKLGAEGVPMACYGDDVVLVTSTVEEAHRAFVAFEAEAESLGFKNVRPLGTVGKASRIHDARTEAVPLIKTFQVTLDRIGLSEGKEAELAARLDTNPTLKEIRRKNKWKAVSKSFLKTVLNRVSAQTPEPTPAEDGPPPTEGTEGRTRGKETLGTQDRNRSDLPSDKPGKEKTDREPNLTLTAKKTVTEKTDPSYREPTPSSESSASGNTITPGPVVGLEKVGGTPCGRSADPRVGSGAGVTAGVKDGRAAGRGGPPSDPVFVYEEDWAVLASGKRLRAGDRYRGCLVDVRDLVTEVPARRLPHAVAQLARAASVKGRAAFLVHPGDARMADDASFPGLRRVDARFHPLGQVVVLRRATAGRTETPPYRRKDPPDADLVVLSVRRRRDDVRAWTAKVKEGGVVRSISMKVCSTNPSVARLEVVAAIVQDFMPKSVAVRTDGLAESVLLGGARPRLVDLGDANRALTRWWTWCRARGWLVGEQV